MPLLCELTGESAPVAVIQDETGMVQFVADADVDADGANGQRGKQAAYMLGDRGSDFLANGGMQMRDGEVVFAHEWGKDIVIHNGKKPIVQAGGIIASRTAWKDPGKSHDDPAAYVDSETVPYVVVSPLIRQRARGVVLGCRAVAKNIRTGEAVECIVADIGPRNKAGEVSIEAARRLGLNPSPRVGGTDARIILYKLFPGEQTTIDGITYALIPA